MQTPTPITDSAEFSGFPNPTQAAEGWVPSSKMRALELELAEARRRGDRMDQLLDAVQNGSQPDVEGKNWFDAAREALAEWRAGS